jgi:aerobic carbon-monoxide dehydrogenase medium subunit
MKFPPFVYQRAGSLDEACEMLAVDGARPLGGGQSLLPLMALRLARPSILVDVSSLDELAGFDSGPQAKNALEVGGITTHSELESSAAVRTKIPVLAAVARLIGHPPIRNRGTVGGSIAHADPAAELPAACIALDAELVIASVDGTRRERVESFVTGPYQTSLRENEFVTRVSFPTPPGRLAGVAEVALRAGDFALAGAICVLDAEDTSMKATITFFGVEAKPRRFDLDLGRARSSSGDTYWKEFVAVLGEVVEDSHADALFRRHLAAVVARRAFVSALDSEKKAAA